MPGGLKLFHDKYARNIKEHEEYAAEFDEAVLHNEQMKHCLHKVDLQSRSQYQNSLQANSRLVAFHNIIGPCLSTTLLPKSCLCILPTTPTSLLLDGALRAS